MPTARLDLGGGGGGVDQAKAEDGRTGARGPERPTGGAAEKGHGIIPGASPEGRVGDLAGPASGSGASGGKTTNIWVQPGITDVGAAGCGASVRAALDGYPVDALTRLRGLLRRHGLRVMCTEKRTAVLGPDGAVCGYPPAGVSELVFGFSTGAGGLTVHDYLLEHPANVIDAGNFWGTDERGR